MELPGDQCVLQVAQFKEFFKAARHLGYSQAAITIQIKQLEQELDVHLFDRIGKQISPDTGWGTVFRTRQHHHAGNWPRPVKTLSRDRKLHGTLRIGNHRIYLAVSPCFPRWSRKYHTPLSGSQCQITPRLPGNLIKQTSPTVHFRPGTISSISRSMMNAL